MLLLQGCFHSVHHKIHLILPVWLKSVPPPVIPCRPRIQFNGCIPTDLLAVMRRMEEGWKAAVGILCTATPLGSCGCFLWADEKLKDRCWGSVSCKQPPVAARPHDMCEESSTEARGQKRRRQKKRNPEIDYRCSGCLTNRQLLIVIRSFFQLTEKICVFSLCASSHKIVTSRIS